MFVTVPDAFTEEELEEWLAKLTDVAVSSDAFVSSPRDARPVSDLY